MGGKSSAKEKKQEKKKHFHKLCVHRWNFGSELSCAEKKEPGELFFFFLVVRGGSRDLFPFLHGLIEAINNRNCDGTFSEFVWQKIRNNFTFKRGKRLFLCSWRVLSRSWIFRVHEHEEAINKKEAALKERETPYILFFPPYHMSLLKKESFSEMALGG